jgi:hypothetical protein
MGGLTFLPTDPDDVQKQVLKGLAFGAFKACEKLA